MGRARICAQTGFMKHLRFLTVSLAVLILAACLLAARPASAQSFTPSFDAGMAAFNVGDGPAAFLIFIVGGLVVGLAIWVELAFSPPFWVHPLLWIPLAAVGTIGLLRVGKGLLLILEYRREAREGRLKDKR